MINGKLINLKNSKPIQLYSQNITSGNMQYIAPSNGFIYITINNGGQRKFINIYINNDDIGAFATSSENTQLTQTFYLSKGDIIKTSELSNTTFIVANRTKFIAIGQS